MTKKIKVFLGGTVNNSTWREELIPQLESTRIDYFNPVVADWNEEVQKEEIRQREEVCDLLLYVITKELLGFYSIAEVVDDSTKRPEKTIFCYLEEGFGKHQIKSLKATGELVRKNGVQVFTSLEGVMKYLGNLNVERLKEQMKEIVDKLKSKSANPILSAKKEEERDKKLGMLFEDFPTNKESLKERIESIKKGLIKRLTEEEINSLCQIKVELNEIEEKLEENLQERQIQEEVPPK